MNTERIKIWDLPVRIFHWLLFLLIVGAIVSGKVGGGAIEWHGRIGLAIIGLLVFRIVWGFVGSSHARFSSFLPRPSSLRAYLRGAWKGVGHNPLGALSVLALLALFGVQAATLSALPTSRPWDPARGRMVAGLREACVAARARHPLPASLQSGPEPDRADVRQAQGALAQGCRTHAAGALDGHRQPARCLRP